MRTEEPDPEESPAGTRRILEESRHPRVAVSLAPAQQRRPADAQLLRQPVVGVARRSPQHHARAQHDPLRRLAAPYQRLQPLAVLRADSQGPRCRREVAVTLSIG